jgi:predicted nuclease of restriction endonuclease-like (RecB) superfamily
MKDNNTIQPKVIDNLFERVSIVIENTRQMIASTINTGEIYAKYEIGRHIVESEQNGEQRAQYGKHILKDLSEKLTATYGAGWSYSNLRQIRQFYIIYSNLTNTVCQIKNDNRYLSNSVKQTTKYNNDTNIGLNNLDRPKFSLSWSHYLILMRIENPDERSFYEIECNRQMWSVRQLSRQVNSSLYERLALSRDKDSVIRLAQDGLIVEKPSDIIKNPITLEFLGLKPDAIYTESKLENAIIGKMQHFLLELGKGFLFEARQKRFTFDEQHFYVDLVFYNRLLQCYVLIDLKTDRLSHQDLGQMQMYVNYYDRYMKQEFEKPTIGILLCKEKSDALVQLTLPEEANIYATQYSLYLPDKTLLQSKLKQWIEEFEENNEE